MNIGIIIHSQTGHTAKVARLLSTTLTDQGHGVTISHLKTVGKEPSKSKSFDFKSIPSVEKFDCLILGGPVWAFSASPVIMKFINQLGQLTGKRALCFVTKGLPFLWTGGTRAINSMNKGLATSGVTILKGEVFWTPAAVSEEKTRPSIDRIIAVCSADSQCSNNVSN